MFLMHVKKIKSWNILDLLEDFILGLADKLHTDPHVVVPA